MTDLGKTTNGDDKEKPGLVPPKFDENGQPLSWSWVGGYIYYPPTPEEAAREAEAAKKPRKMIIIEHTGD